MTTNIVISEHALGSEPDDLAFRSGDLFPLGTPFGAVDSSSEPLSAPDERPYGLRHAIPVSSDRHMTSVDAGMLTLCPVRQITLLGGEPLSVEAARTNGKTKIPYDTDTTPKTKRDQRDDVRDD